MNNRICVRDTEPGAVYSLGFLLFIDLSRNAFKTSYSVDFNVFEKVILKKYKNTLNSWRPAVDILFRR